MPGSCDPAVTGVPSAGGWRGWEQALGTTPDQCLSPCVPSVP